MLSWAVVHNGAHYTDFPPDFTAKRSTKSKFDPKNADLPNTHPVLIMEMTSSRYGGDNIWGLGKTILSVAEYTREDGDTG